MPKLFKFAIFIIALGFTIWDMIMYFLGYNDPIIFTIIVISQFFVIMLGLQFYNKEAYDDIIYDLKDILKHIAEIFRNKK